MAFKAGRYSEQNSSYGIRSRRKRRRRTALLIVLSVLILMLLVALVFIIKDLIERKKDPVPVGPADTSSVADSGTHSVEMAYDGKTSTYFKSKQNQVPGSWFLVDIGSEIEIGKVSVISDHSDLYIRAADIQISSDNEEYTTLASFSGSRDEAEAHDAIGGGAKASYVRIYLTESSGTGWVINEITILDSNFNTVKPRSASSRTPAEPSNVTGTAAVTTGSQSPQGETTRVVSNDDMYTGTLILVGAGNRYHFPASDANIQDMYVSRTPFTVDGKTVYSYQVGGSGVSLLDATALRNFNAMCDAFYKETGINTLHVGANSGYRSEQTQAELAAKYATAAASGYSEHNTGLAANINIFENGGSYELDNTVNPHCATALAWISANAHKYGFIDRYPPSKDSVTQMSIDRFHYRYVGYPHAYYMKTNNMCLEEYLTFLEASCDYSGTHLKFTADDGRSFEIYFVRASAGGTTTLTVPADSSTYTISGNNFSGFIVTIEK